ncbi:MAG TPA: glycosyl transferase family 2 [Clostridiales bacterium]|nr:glycosyl transferase family 2 [Clostridiales bacterium]
MNWEFEAVVIIEFVIVLIGLAATAVLFFRFPTLPGIRRGQADYPAVSVIIPARNEAHNLPLLLMDLRRQTIPVSEIIVADDGSEDATARIAAACGARVITLNKKPEGWTGKAWACQNGADAARSGLLLFLDADVRLGPEGIEALLQAYANERCTISVQPWHRTEKIYEQLSLMFNLVQIGANGIALPKPLNLGLFGPVILIASKDYIRAGGHEKVRKSVVEDIALGRQLKKAGLPYRLFTGNPAVAFRMYGHGLRELLQGWVKNLATGAAQTPAPVFLLVFFWIASLTSVPLQIVKFAVTSNWPWLAVYMVLHLVWIVLIAVLARRAGRFQAWAYFLYPLLMLTLLGVFAVSLVRRIFRLKVTWKGRAIVSEEKPCE